MPPPLFSVDAAFLGPFGFMVPPLLAGAAAVYLLLPRPKAYPALWGALLGVVALGLAGWLIVGFGATTESFLFYVFAATAVGFGGLLVTQRNPARAALAFAVVVLSTCGLFLLLAAPFLMAATIIIYAGAVIVTFLFVLMLAQQEGPSDADARSREPMLAVAIGFVLLGALLYVLQLQWNHETDEQGRMIEALLDNVKEAKKGLNEEALQDADKAKQYQRPELLKPLIEKLAEKDYGLNTIKEALRKLHEKAPAEGAALEERQKELAGLERDRQMLERAREPLVKLQARLENILYPLSTETTLSVKEVDEALTKVQIALLQTKQLHGWPQPEPAADRASNLSSFSGPQPDLPADQVRADPDAGGRPYMPADNPAYLGRSLFTDYLLPVELGGFLLLVAAIGAIAIAQRGASSERS